MDFQTFNRIEGLVKQTVLNTYIKSARDIFSDLYDEGFEITDIEEYLLECLKKEKEATGKISVTSILKKVVSNLSRKPETFEVAKGITLTKEEFKVLRNELDLVSGENLATPFSGVKKTAQIFLLKRKNKIYLVDTQGYDYCRYLGIIGINPVL